MDAEAGAALLEQGGTLVWQAVPAKLSRHEGGALKQQEAVQAAPEVAPVPRHAQAGAGNVPPSTRMEVDVPDEAQRPAASATLTPPTPTRAATSPDQSEDF